MENGKDFEGTEVFLRKPRSTFAVSNPIINQKNGITLDDQKISISKDVNKIFHKISYTEKCVVLSLKK